MYLTTYGMLPPGTFPFVKWNKSEKQTERVRDLILRRDELVLDSTVNGRFEKIDEGKVSRCEKIDQKWKSNNECLTSVKIYRRQQGTHLTRVYK